MADNKLYYGDNLDLLRKHIADESVDLVYLDPPFNSSRNYNVLFGKHNVHGASDAAQIEAFGDTWVWTPVTDMQFARLAAGEVPAKVFDALQAMKMLIGENDAMAYLVNMTPRLVELRRVLKPTGSLFLHCDPTMSHYLKVLLDAIFGLVNFRNEIIWKRTAAKGLSSTRLANNHDVLLCYTATPKATWNEDEAFVPYDHDALDARTLLKYSHRDPDGRIYRLSDITNPNRNRPNLTYEFMGMTKVWRWTRERMQQAYDDGIIVQSAPGRIPQMKRYLDEQRGRPLSDVWADISPLNSQAAERLGYPTQKPLELMERIIRLSTNEGDVVLDPFCGCGTTIDAAIRLKRHWIGIDVTYIAVDLIEKRLLHTYGAGVVSTYDVLGIPRDMGGALALFTRSPFEFERWAVTRINAQPNEKQVGDKGIDGVARFPTDAKGGFGRIIVSVKGGKTVGPDFVRDLLGTVTSQKAQMGVLISMAEPTRGTLEAVNHSGTYSMPGNANLVFDKIQIITVAQLLKGERPKMPQTLLPYIAATKRAVPKSKDSLF